MSTEHHLETVAEHFLYPYVRFFHASPKTPEVTFLVDDQKISTLDYGAFSKYEKIAPGMHMISILGCDGRPAQIPSIPLEISDGKVYTIALIGTDGNASLIAIPEPTERNALEISNLRIANLSPDSPDVDVYANGFPILQDLEYPLVSRYIYLKPDHYTYQFRPENSQEALLTVPGQTAEIGKYYTLYLIGKREGGEPYSAVVSLDAASYVGKYL